MGDFAIPAAASPARCTFRRRDTISEMIPAGCSVVVVVVSAESRRCSRRETFRFIRIFVASQLRANSPLVNPTNRSPVLSIIPAVVGYALSIIHWRLRKLLIIIIIALMIIAISSGRKSARTRCSPNYKHFPKKKKKEKKRGRSYALSLARKVGFRGDCLFSQRLSTFISQNRNSGASHRARGTRMRAADIHHSAVIHHVRGNSRQ